MQNLTEIKKRITAALSQLRIIKDPDVTDLPYIKLVHSEQNRPCHNAEGWNAAKSGFVTNEKMFPREFTDFGYNPSCLTGTCNAFGAIMGSPNFLEAAGPTIGSIKSVSAADVASGKANKIGISQKYDLLTGSKPSQ